MMHVSFMGMAAILNDVWDHLPIVFSTFTQIKCNPACFTCGGSYSHTRPVTPGTIQKCRNVILLFVIKGCVECVKMHYVASCPKNIAIVNDLQANYSNLHRIIRNCDSRIVNISHLTWKQLQVPILLLESQPFCWWCSPDGLFLTATTQGRNEGHRKCVRKGNKAMTPTAIDLMKCYMRSAVFMWKRRDNRMLE